MTVYFQAQKRTGGTDMNGKCKVTVKIVGRGKNKMIRKITVADGFECVSYTPYEWLNPPSDKSKKIAE
jgi:hypothetical protein